MHARIFLCLLAFVLTGVSFANGQTTAREKSPTSTAGRFKEFGKQQELVNQLAEQHGYKLGQGELLKYVPESENEPRQELLLTFSKPTSLAEWINQPREQQETFEPCLLLFEQTRAGSLRWASCQDGIFTLSDVLRDVLNLKKHQIDCPPELLMTYMPGDWVLSWNPQQPHELSDSDLAAFEKILNEEKDLGVKVTWKTVEKPALVITGKYQANPKSEEGADNSGSYEGSFGLLARRSHVAGTGGTYDDFKQAIGEALMLPVIDEAKVRPEMNSFVWIQTGTPVMNSERLPAEDEARVIKSLHEQLGYDLTIEPREVKLLSIEPIEP